MEKHLFLQGDIGIGKSTLIRDAVLPYIDEFAGFFVQRIFVGQRVVGFSLRQLFEAKDYLLSRHVSKIEEVSNLFLYRDACGQWHHDLRIFRREGIAALRRGRFERKKFILIDELGGVELQDIAFMEEVLTVLDGDIPVLGVLKSPKGIEKIQNRTGKINIRERKVKEIYTLLAEHQGVSFLEITEMNRTYTAKKIREFVWGRFCNEPNERLDGPANQ